MELIELYQLAEKEKIPVYCFDLPQTQSLSIKQNNGDCAIAIDPFCLDSTNEEAVHLAHELGHCITGSFYNRYSEFDIMAKSEHKAEKWAIKKLVPEDELQKRFIACFSFIVFIITVCLSAYSKIISNILLG